MGLFSGIYQIRNTTTGQIYVGSAVHMEKRKKTHFDKLRSGVHANRHLQASFVKHGEDAFCFSALENVPDEKRLVEREQEWMNDLRKASVSLYNQRLIAKSNLGLKQPLESIEKRKRTFKERGFKPGTHVRTPEMVARIVASKTGVPHPRKGDFYTLVCKYGHQKTLYSNGKMRCKPCRANQMKFYNALNAMIQRGG